MKRGQITLFVILGIIIFTIIILGIVFRSEVTNIVSSMELMKTEEMERMEQDLSFYATKCLKRTTVESIQQLFFEGGYYENAPNSINFHAYKVPFYLYLNTEFVPSKEEFAINLAKSIESDINNCIAGYSEGNLVLDTPNVEVFLADNVRVEASHSMTLMFNESRIRINNYMAEVDFDFNQVYNSAMEFYDIVKNVSDSNFVSQGAIALENDFDFDSLKIGESMVVFMLRFSNVLESDKDIDLNFIIIHEKDESLIIEDLSFYDLMDYSLFGHVGSDIGDEIDISEINQILEVLESL